ncbi:hypothetical protein MtrunA17_Chr7g0232041 [Medicago truncatula]|uniref:Transmembrane protein, putative n=1 Tax=Medicago truncatula TaxID=3880 RepID=G7KTZ1_MEDTR|nr:transmembrane protein, putative [Medicago truncatula]RHN45511.1 hypothetical protein MtrunA17_Chr7g0232041 [Medicago truncatula]
MTTSLRRPPLSDERLLPATTYFRRIYFRGTWEIFEFHFCLEGSSSLWCAAAGTVGAVVEATLCSAGFGGSIVIAVLVSATYLTPKYSFA